MGDSFAGWKAVGDLGSEWRFERVDAGEFLRVGEVGVSLLALSLSF
jgi:hypothetical protein